MTDFMVRPYQPEDRESVFRIGADTAFFGDPIEAYMEDRNVFLDAFYAYYTDLEPEHTWVACADETVVGFLTGCIDSRLHGRKYRRFILPGLIDNILRGKYRFGKRSFGYLTGMLGGVLRGELTHTDLDIYPAHLHINVDSGLARSSTWPTVDGSLPAAIARSGSERRLPGHHQLERSCLPAVRENGLSAAGGTSGPVLGEMVWASG